MRHRLVIGCALLLALTVPLQAQWSYTKTAAEVTVAGTAIALFTAADVQAGNGHVQAVQAVCSLTGANIRISFDGTDPTTNQGQILTPGQYIVSGNAVLQSLKGIRDDSTSATWNCVVYGN